MAILSQGGASGDARIDPLLRGKVWSGTVSFGFPDAASDYPGTFSSVERSNNFGAASSELQRIFTYFTSLVSGYTNLAFTNVGSQAANITAAYTGAVTTTNPAHALWNVSGTTAEADIWFDTTFNFRAPRVGDYAYLTVLHELGHALGLKHPFETDGVVSTTLAAMWDWLGYTVMSYRSYQGDDLNGYSNETFGYPTTYMANDILALQEMYGANYTTNSGNTVYTWSSTTGQSFVNGVAGPKPGDGLGATFDSSMNRVFMALWDGGGEDTLDFSNFNNAAYINLQPGAWSNFTNLPNLGNGRSGSNLYMSWLVDGNTASLIENVIGGAGNDQLIGNVANNKLTGNAGIDVLSGLAGDDTLTAGAGGDTLIGGQGRDTAVFSGAFGAAAIDYFAVNTGGWLSVNVGDGRDAVSVEQLQFSDRSVEAADFLSYDPNPPRLTNGFDNRVIASSTGTYVAELSFNFSEQVELKGGNLRIYYADGALFKTYALSDIFQDGQYQAVRFPQPDKDGQYYIEIDAGAFVDASGKPMQPISGPNALNFTIGAVDDYPDLPTIDKYSGSFGDNAAYNQYVATYKKIDIRTLSDPLNVTGYISSTDGDAQDFQRIVYDPNKIYLIKLNNSGPNDANATLLIESIQRDTYLGTQWLYYIRPQIGIDGQALVKFNSGEYWIGIGGGNGSYSYTITEWTYGDDAINDFYSGTPPQNGKVPLGGSVQGILYSGGSIGVKDSVGRDLEDARGDTDWLQVDLVAGQTYRFQVETGASTYAGFDVTGQVGMRLYRNYQATAGVYSGTYNETPPYLASTVTPTVSVYGGTASAGAGQFEFTATETGTSWLRVIGVGGSPSGYGVAAPYTVSVATTASNLVPVLTPPSLVSTETSFANGTQTFVLTFSEAVKPGAGEITVNLNGQPVERIDVSDTSRVVVSGNTVTIKGDPANILLGPIKFALNAGAFLDLQGARLPLQTPEVLTAAQVSSTANDQLATTATAGTIAVGERISTSITAASDADWFKATLTGGVTYDVAVLLPANATVTTKVTVRDAAGAVLATNAAAAGGSGAAHLVFTPTATGTYFIDVGGSQALTYSLQLLSFDAGITKTGTSSSEYISGTAFADVLKGGAGGDMIDGRGGDDQIFGDAGDDLLSGGTGADTLTGGLGNDTIDGGVNVDTAVVAGNRSAYTVTANANGSWSVTGPDGTDLLTNVEFLKFSDQTIRLYPGQGTSINFATDNPATYMAAIRDFDGNDVGNAAGWKLIGSADVNGDGDVDRVFVNKAAGRFAEVGTAPDGKVYFGDYGWAGETRVVGIYVDPLVASGQVVAGSDHDSQRRFQNDLRIDNIKTVLGAGDYDHNGLQEVYFSLTDGTAFLHAYMHADGNIQYANYQSQAQVIAYLQANGWAASTYNGWFV